MTDDRNEVYRVNDKYISITSIFLLDIVIHNMSRMLTRNNSAVYAWLLLSTPWPLCRLFHPLLWSPIVTIYYATSKISWLYQWWFRCVSKGVNNSQLFSLLYLYLIQINNSFDSSTWHKILLLYKDRQFEPPQFRNKNPLKLWT